LATDAHSYPLQLYIEPRLVEAGSEIGP